MPCESLSCCIHGLPGHAVELRCKTSAHTTPRHVPARDHFLFLPQQLHPPASKWTSTKTLPAQWNVTVTAPRHGLELCLASHRSGMTSAVLCHRERERHHDLLVLHSVFRAKIYTVFAGHFLLISQLFVRRDHSNCTEEAKPLPGEKKTLAPRSGGLAGSPLLLF
ncbi:hypothetical protein AC578_8619 [Pseudocercospora eumusae]|uniref:Uncharacterized protein n=1 Tax=Pseudocercospora eumusae TaxID=321146 RepID=A0A139HVW9_9PEZI|nr:hypothetical protein AC578_8619 [Pseudocercospora eumusae]